MVDKENRFSIHATSTLAPEIISLATITEDFHHGDLAKSWSGNTA